MLDQHRGTQVAPITAQMASAYGQRQLDAQQDRADTRPATMRTTTRLRAGDGLISIRLQECPAERGAVWIFGYIAGNEIARDFGVRQFEKLDESGLFFACRRRESLPQVAGQQQVEFLHASPAAPFSIPRRSAPSNFREVRAPLVLSLNHHLLDLGDRLRRVQVFRAGLGAIHDGVAAIKPERVLELVESFAGGLVARIDDPAVRSEQRGGTEIAIAVPPVTRAGRRTAGAEDAGRRPVDLFLIFARLRALAIGRRGRTRLQPGLHRRVLRVEVGQVGHEVLHHRHVRQWINLHVPFDLAAGLRAGQRVEAADVHRAAAADSFTAGAAKRQRGIDLVLDLEQRVQNHRTARVHVDFVGVHSRVLPGVRIEAVDDELADVFRARGRLVGLAR